LPVDIRSGAKAFAVTCQDDRAGIADFAERLRQLADQLGIEGVPTLWPSKRDPEKRPISVDSQRAHRSAA
jgi:hypothetical protein